MFKFLRRKFSRPVNLTILNAILISIGVTANILEQVFCIPSAWALVVLIICFSNVILYPLLKKFRHLAPFLSFINGISCCVFLYCIIFLGPVNIWGIIGIAFFGLGLITYIPHFFMIQIFWTSVIKPHTKSMLRYFISGVLISLFIAMYFGYAYHQAIGTMNKFKESHYAQLDKSFMTEKILGMHFIYHTRFCEYDGWRPPVHEPALIIGMWFNGMYDPLNEMQGTSLEERIALYKKFYPGNKVKFKCSCAMDGSRSYHNDKRLE